MIGDGGGTRPWVYVAAQKGKFQHIHRISGSVLIAFYLLLPWISFGDQRLLFLDLPNRRFHIFGQVFTAVDTQYLLVFLLVGGFGILLFTALLGRIWCGYACPQTVFLEEWIRPVEKWIEGRRGTRRRLDKSPWTPSKIRKKTLKAVVFVGMSLVLSMTFVAFFVPKAWELWALQRSSTAYIFVGVFTVVTYADLAWFREQFCNYICPYARFQGALCDAKTLTIGYDKSRGEPRGRPKQRVERLTEMLGDGEAALAVQSDKGLCVNCSLCVNVCPQGIDIREGFQLECITCGHCIDACEQVMSKQGTLPTLVAYTTEAKLAGEVADKRHTRAWVYAFLMAGLILLLAVMLIGRSAIDATVVRAPGMPFQVRDDGRIQNIFRAHLFNNDLEDRTFDLSVSGIDGMEVIMPTPTVDLAAGAERTLPVFVLVEPEFVTERTTDIEFVIRSGAEEIRRVGTFQSGVGR